VGQATGAVREIRIKADRDLKAGSLTALLEQLRDAGFTRVQLVTQIAGR
jgi:biopolymer transport protein ExbD